MSLITPKLRYIYIYIYIYICSRPAESEPAVEARLGLWRLQLGDDLEGSRGEGPLGAVVEPLDEFTASFCGDAGWELPRQPHLALDLEEQTVLFWEGGGLVAQPLSPVDDDWDLGCEPEPLPLVSAPVREARGPWPNRGGRVELALSRQETIARRDVPDIKRLRCHWARPDMRVPS